MPELRPAAPLLVLALALEASPALAQGATAWRTDFSRHTVPLEEIVPGGPPKDGIPALDHPRFASVTEADAWLSERDPVVLLGEADEAKAYPLQILLWHEIVNDLVAGRPVAVTFCPLCNTALAFERRLDGVVLDFGTTGRLRHSDLIMYDRQTESWWQQATGEGIVGTPCRSPARVRERAGGELGGCAGARHRRPAAGHQTSASPARKPLLVCVGRVQAFHAGRGLAT